jgi:regulator of RNase E activity RraA
MIKNLPKLISKDIIKEYKKLSVALVCDAMTELEVINNGCMVPEMKPIHQEMFMIGTALTVETSGGDNLAVHLASYQNVHDGYVMVVDGKGFRERAYVGELIASASLATGYAGIVVDGYTRDRKECVEIGLPIFSLGLVPAGPFRKSLGKTNESICCGGVTVNPGDLIFGDGDGVCVVPAALVEKVLEIAIKKQSYENERFAVAKAYIKAKENGAELPQIAPSWALEYMKK